MVCSVQLQWKGSQMNSFYELESVASAFLQKSLKAAVRFIWATLHMLEIRSLPSISTSSPRSSASRSKSRKMSFAVILPGRNGLGPLQLYMSLGKSKILYRQSLPLHRRYWVSPLREVKGWSFPTHLSSTSIFTSPRSREQRMRKKRFVRSRKSLQLGIERSSQQRRLSK